MGTNDEGERAHLKALEEYQILDTESESDFDDITLLVAELCDVPIAPVSLVDDTRQWFKSKVGLAATQTPRDVAFCAQAILHPELMVVEDAT